MQRPTGKRIIFGLALLLLLALGVARVLWERCGLGGCPAVDRLDRYVPDRAAKIVDRHGVELARLHLVPRELVPLDSLPPHVPQAFVAIEDQRFWQHHGIDWRRAMGAAIRNLRSFRVREGFSTITMQLARNAFPDRLPYTQRTIARKLAEMRVARSIEERYTKREILELYLNGIYFGSGAWGIEAAAREYFGKPASRLTLAEAALLAGMVTAPNGLNPRVNPELAYRRRWVVLHVMWRQGLITEAEANIADDAPLITLEGSAEAGDLAPYYVEEIRHLLDREIGEALYTEGYTVHATLDAGVQRAAEAELRDRLAAIEAGRFGRYEHPAYVPRAERGAGPAGADSTGTGYLQGAVLVLDARTGDVLAMVGGRDFSDSRFNRAVLARRPPASTFKPFVYAAAIEHGYTPIHMLDDSPIRRNLGGGRTWAPRNMGGRYADAITLRDALVLSSNTATIRLAEAVGLDRVVATAQRMGLRRPLPRVPALALGAAETTLLELTAAYAAFATLGRRPDPRLVLRVEDSSGRVVWRQEATSQEVLDPGVAFLITDILRDAVDRGTGAGVRAAGYRGPAAGKTGTTNDATDYWFIGFTPTRVAGIWIGFDRPQPIVEDVTSEGVVPALWGRIMRRAGPRDEAPWVPPPSVVALRVDGRRVYAPECRLDDAARTEYFLVGTVPASDCTGSELPAPSVPVTPPPRAIPAPAADHPPQDR
jgi:penicillin-binding protein 1A